MKLSLALLLLTPLYAQTPAIVQPPSAETLAAIRAYGPLVGRCLADETAALRPELLALLIAPRLRFRLTSQIA